jgi:hypothetical protein
MRPRTTLLTAMACASLALIAACSNQTTGQPTATTSAASSSGLPKDGAPAVASPIVDTAASEKDPCSTIPTTDIEGIGGKVESSRVNDLALGKSCVWILADSKGTVSAGMVVGNKDGLSGIYYQSTHGGLTTFKPLPEIDGYPAVVYANGGERPYTCTLALGVRDDLVYTISSQLRTGNPFYNDACGLNTKIAQVAVQKLKGA